MTDARVAEIAGAVPAAVAQVEGACSDAVSSILTAHPNTCGPITCTDAEWSGQEDAFAARDAFYAAMMPTERDAIKLMHSAFERLKALGWCEAIYCPKDGSIFDAIEPGSTGIHPTSYDGEWPTGSWWAHSEGDLWPSRPVLYRPTEAEVAERERRREALRAHLHPAQSDDVSPSGVPARASPPRE